MLCVLINVFPPLLRRNFPENLIMSKKVKSLLSCLLSCMYIKDLFLTNSIVSNHSVISFCLVFPVRGLGDGNYLMLMSRVSFCFCDNSNLFYPLRRDCQINSSLLPSSMRQNLVHTVSNDFLSLCCILV